MQSYWHETNREVAARNTLYMLIGMLKAERDGIPELGIKGKKKKIDIDEVLAYIDKETAQEEERLNKAFPDKASKGEPQ